MSSTTRWDQLAHLGNIHARADVDKASSKVGQRIKIHFFSRNRATGTMETILTADMGLLLFLLLLIPGTLILLVAALLANLWEIIGILSNAKYRVAKRRIAQHGDYVSRLTDEDIERMKKKTEGLPLGL